MEDGCTCFWNGTWVDCCNRHDRRYTNAKLTRYQADVLLRRCVAKHSKLIAWIMFIGVRLFGSTRYTNLNKEEK